MAKKITPPISSPCGRKAPVSTLLPELNKWCAELNDAYRAGVAWQPFLRDYCQRIGSAGTLALVREVFYLQLVGRGHGAGPDILLGTLGLDRAILIEEDRTAQQFVDDLLSELLLPQVT